MLLLILSERDAGNSECLVGKFWDNSSIVCQSLTAGCKCPVSPRNTQIVDMTYVVIEIFL